MKQQFTIQTITDCTIEYEGTIEYSIDNGHTWNCLTNLSLPAGHEAQFRNAQSKGNDSFIIEGYFNVSGHISTLAPNGTTAFMWMFLRTNVVDASKLILDYDELWARAYYGMFQGCTSLTTAPALPATELAYGCYSFMFRDCTSLATAPELPATTLAYRCYSYMFDGCTSLTTAPELPATTLTQSCYAYMFWGCTRLITAPSVLPATTLAQGCYYYMFYGCISLVNPPSSIGTSSTTMSENACTSMFAECTSLTTAPELPATELAPCCYAGMFYGCENLTTAPMLLAAKAKDKSYFNMFIACKSLKKRPVMPRKAYLEAVKMGFLPKELIWNKQLTIEKFS